MLSFCRSRSRSSCAWAKARSLSFHSRSRGVCDQAIVRINQHEAPLGEIGFEPGTFNGTKPELIGFIVTHFNLLADLQGQLDGRRCHLGGDQFVDRDVDGAACDRLACRFATELCAWAAHIPCLLLAAPGDVASPEMPAAASAHRASLQQC